MESFTPRFLKAAAAHNRESTLWMSLTPFGLWFMGCLFPKQGSSGNLGSRRTCDWQEPKIFATTGDGEFDPPSKNTATV